MITKIGSNAITQELRDFIDAGDSGVPGYVHIYDDNVFKTTGTAISFDSNLTVTSTGTVAFVSSAGGAGYTEGARVYRTAGIGLSGDTVIPFTDERYDTDNMHSGSSTQLFCNTAGKYIIVGNFEFSANVVTGTRNIFVKYNGITDIGRSGMDAVSAAGNPTRMNISTIYSLAQGDYVELFANSSAAGVSGSAVSNRSPEFSIQRIG